MWKIIPLCLFFISCASNDDLRSNALNRCEDNYTNGNTKCAVLISTFECTRNNRDVSCEQQMNQAFSDSSRCMIHLERNHTACLISANFNYPKE